MPFLSLSLILLVVSMVSSEQSSRGLPGTVSQVMHDHGAPVLPMVEDDRAVITIEKDGSLKLNQDPIKIADLADRLKTIFKNRLDRFVFMKADGDLPFERVTQVIDIVRGVGIDHIIPITPAVEAYQ